MPPAEKKTKICRYWSMLVPLVKIKLF